MFSLRDLHFALCSLDLDVLRAQRIIDFFYLGYPQINGVRKSDHMDEADKKDVYNKYVPFNHVILNTEFADRFYQDVTKMGNGE